MAKKRSKKNKPETLHKGNHLQLLKDGKWEYADRVKGTGVVAIVAVTENNELILTEQYRPPIRKKVIDLPAGLAGDIKGQETEDCSKAAKRELLEETGFKAKTMDPIFTGPSSPGMVTEMISFYLGGGLKKVSAGGGDASEDIKVHLVSLDKIQKWMKRKTTSRTCIDPKVYAALGILHLHADASW